MHTRIICFIMVLRMMMATSDLSLLYNTDRKSKSVFDCFYADIVDDVNQIDEVFLRTNYLTPYCRRPSSNDSIEEIQGNIINTITFETLRSQSISSQQLLQWSISIDIIQQYAIYLITNDARFDQHIFYNCSSFWFGSHCQYTYDFNMSTISFGDFVVSSFDNRKEFVGKVKINTCYPHLSECYRGLEAMCLDWREICDGKIDCIGDSFGIDEKYCNELEMNECKEDEYRCHNGAQCIPLAFFRDSWTSKDCLDGTDENEEPIQSQRSVKQRKLDCLSTAIFACEDTTCRYPRSFSCGDGECQQSSMFTSIDSIKAFCTGTGRDFYYKESIIHALDKSLPSDCYQLLFCKLKFYKILTNDAYNEQECLAADWLLSNNCSMEFLSFPAKSIFDYIRLTYLSKNLVRNSMDNVLPDFICNDPRHCSHLPSTTSQIEGLNCRPIDQINTKDYIGDIFSLYFTLVHNCSLMGNTNKFLSSSSLFHCQSSDRYISKHRVIDGVADCYNKEDETYLGSCKFNDTQRFRCTSEKKCLSPIGYGFALPDCIDGEDTFIDISQQPIFPRICNAIPDKLMKYNDIETDESNCERWPCNNPYTRCDNVFQCANGIDEIGCPNSTCDDNEFKCNNNDTTNYQCIPQEYIYEKPINCNAYKGNGSILCRKLFYSSNLTNNKAEYLSWKEKTCLTKHDICVDQSVSNHQAICNMVEPTGISICNGLLLNMHDNERVCDLTSMNIPAHPIRFFSTWNLGYLPSKLNIISSPSQQNTHTKATKPVSMNNSIGLIEYCNRGILIYEGKSYNKKCLCPPSYFGSQCQWQSQRISLTLRIRQMGSSMKFPSIYHIFIYLIDDEHQTIHSYEEIYYISSIDSETKFNRYLLYPTRPKDQNHAYSIHIDVYDKITLTYYASWHLLIPFPFLPVNRLATQIIIPFEKSQPLTSCSLKCGIHGKCFNYINSRKPFCKCNVGYSGRFCNLQYQCSCSSDSLCLTSSICLCPLNKFGSQCVLQHTYCKFHNPCKNNGQCIPINDRMNKHDSICLCMEGYMGSYCEHKSNRIDINFQKDIISPIIFAHFITAFDDKKHERITRFKKVPSNQHSITLFHPHPFHILFIQILNNFYLTVLREKFIPSEHISTDIKIDNMCVGVTQLLNSTILNFNYLRRLKYYQLPCLENSKLKCFFDEKHICICDNNRYSNCLEFDHHKTYNCQGYNHCENYGMCFQDDANYPTTSVCLCQECYYGSRCQFSTKGFSMTLEAILGYFITPFASFVKQSKEVKITAALTIVMLVLGFINGTLSILTFRRKLSVEVGHGMYLLAASIISLFTISIFTIKYWHVVFIQMNVITNRSFIFYNCLLIDVLLKVLLSSGDWLIACAAIEKVFNVRQGQNFNKSKSRCIAKCIIPVIILLTILSYVHDPFYRHLINDEAEQRTWCIVSYSSKIKIYDTSINLFHFITPFIINILSALIILIYAFHARLKVETNASRKTILFGRIKSYKYILIAPCILMILAIPRIIILFLSQCMGSVRNPWLFLTGYYISFVPPLLIVILLILPVEKYSKEFLIVIKRH